MLRSSDILQAAKEILNKAYPYPSYLEDSRDGCDFPCFAVALNLHRRQSGIHKVLCEGRLYVTYFAEKGETDSLYSFLIAKLFGEDADIIYFDFSFAYYDVIDGGAKQDEITQQVTMDYEIKRRT